MHKSKRSHRIDFIFSERESTFCHSEMIKFGFKHQTDYLRFLLHQRMNETTSERPTDFDHPNTRIEKSADLISARFSKLEQILRFLVTNTSLSRGYAMGVVETSNTEVAQTIQQRMIEARDYQRGLFFGIYPEQNETEPKENRG